MFKVAFARNKPRGEGIPSYISNGVKRMDVYFLIPNLLNLLEVGDEVYSAVLLLFTPEFLLKIESFLLFKNPFLSWISFRL